jgi:hypothetical protein
VRALYLVVAVAGCGVDGVALEVVDSTETRFLWECDDRCSLKLLSEPAPWSPPSCEAESTSYGVIADRFFMTTGFCRTEVGGATSSLWYRPLVCIRDTDCPDAPSGGGFECIDRLCQRMDIDLYPREPLVRRDAHLLCRAAYQRPDLDEPSDPAFLEMGLIVNEICPDPESDAPCEKPLPDPCLTANAN